MCGRNLCMEPKHNMPADHLHVQEVIGVLHHYARAVDSTLLKALGTLATQQANGTKATMEENYCATHLHAVI